MVAGPRHRYAGAASDTRFNGLVAARHTLGLIQHHDSLAATMANQWSVNGTYGRYVQCGEMLVGEGRGEAGIMAVG